MKISLALCATHHVRHLAANVEHLATQATTLDDSVVAVNVLAVDNDGWAKLSAYGDFPNQGVKGGVPHVQRVDRAAGERLAANFRPLLKRLLRVHTGLPVFKGHPDAPGFESRFPDKTNYGTIAAVEARDDGIYVKPVITPEGSALVEGGWKFLSSFWNQEEVGRTPDGRPIASPFELKSVGLVLAPNIPGPAINALPENNIMKTQLLQLLAALGFTTAADADDTIVAANATAALAECGKRTADLATLNGTLTAATAEKSTLAANVATLTGEKTALIAEKETLGAELTALKATQLSAANALNAANAAAIAERTVAAQAVVTSAVLTGRFSAAEQPARTAALIAAANFGVDVAEIQKLPSRLKVVERFAPNLDKTAVLDAADRGTKVHAAVNARMNDAGEDYTSAFIAVKNDPKHAALFGAMQKPAV
jgi:hypothetical protein